MAGAHIEREADYARTRLTSLTRDQRILELRRRGMTQARIGQEVGLTQQGVHLALARLAGRPRRQPPRDVCDGCGASVLKSRLDDGWCLDCWDSGR